MQIGWSNAGTSLTLSQIIIYSLYDHTMARWLQWQNHYDIVFFKQVFSHILDNYRLAHMKTTTTLM